jgi:hypothetical protein
MKTILLITVILFISCQDKASVYVQKTIQVLPSGCIYIKSEICTIPLNTEMFNRGDILITGDSGKLIKLDCNTRNTAPDTIGYVYIEENNNITH